MADGDHGPPGYIADLRAEVGSRLLLVPGVTICLYDEGRLLLALHRGSDRWGTPGGTVEVGESVADACRREAREELGIDVDIDALVGVFGPFEVVYRNGDRTAYVTTAFACTATRPPRIADTELAELRWVGAGEWSDLDLDDWLVPRIERLTGWWPGDPAMFDPPRA